MQLVKLALSGQRKTLAIFILIMASMVSTAFGLDISAESKTIRQGEEFTVKVSIQNALELGHTAFDIVYPPDYLELRDVTPQEIALVTDPENTEYQAIYATNPESFPASGTDRLRFGWVFGKGYDGVGDVLTLHFKMGSAEVNEIPIQVESAFAVKAAETLDDQQVQSQDGLITVKFYGDVTDDGNITAYDAARILQHVVGLSSLSGDPLSRADVNGVNGVTAYDASLILMKVVGNIDVFPVLEDEPAAPPALLTARKLSIGDAQIDDRKVKVPVELDLAEDVVSADIKIGYDPSALRFTKTAKTDLTADYRLLTEEGPGEIQICFAGNTPMSGSGAILNLEFDMQDEKTGRSEFEIKHALLNEGVKLELHNGAVEFVPDKTALLPNYPNPFNPETWIPYQLAKDADVLIRIYDVAGRLVRKLDVGFKKAGYYTQKSRASHWDGRNELGERVASGLYFYQLRASGRFFIKRLVVLK